MTSAFDPVERVQIAALTKNKRHELRTELLRMPDDAWRLSVRIFFRDGDEMKASREGFTLAVESLAEFAGQITAASAEAQRRGLL